MLNIENDYIFFLLIFFFLSNSCRFNQLQLLIVDDVVVDKELS